MYSYYPDELIEEIRIRNDIVDVVSEYVKLDKKGSNNFGLCPFHKEKTPSFCVSDTKQIFNCFGCGKGGNVIQFIMYTENLDFIDAVKLLADRAKIDLPESDDKEGREKSKLKQELLQINTEAARFFHSNLTSNKNGDTWNYLIKRGLSESNIRKFGLGFAPVEWDLLYKFLIEKGFKSEIIEKSGLVLKNKNGGFYDRFRARIMFPIFDVRGNVIAFGGRVLDDSQPKYMNSPETAVYNKGKNLFALNLAKNSGETRIIIVEGYMDVISLNIKGITNVVASLGTALTESQGRLLKKYAEEVIISLMQIQRDKLRHARWICRIKSMQVKVLIYGRKDPDDFVRKNGPDEFKRLVDNSISLLEYKVKILQSKVDNNTTDGKIKFLNKVAELLSKVDNNLEREMYIKTLARQYSISEDSIYAEIYKKSRPKTNFRKEIVERKEEGASESSTTSNPATKEIIHNERMLISLICTDNSIYLKMKDKLAVENFVDENNRKIAKIVFDRIESKRGIMPAELLGILSDKEAGEYAEIIQKECNCENNGKAALDIIKRMVVYMIDKRKNEIFNILNNSGNIQETEIEKLKQELNSIVLKRKNL